MLQDLSDNNAMIKQLQTDIETTQKEKEKLSDTMNDAFTYLKVRYRRVRNIKA